MLGLPDFAMLQQPSCTDLDQAGRGYDFDGEASEATVEPDLNLVRRILGREDDVRHAIYLWPTTIPVNPSVVGAFRRREALAAGYGERFLRCSTHWKVMEAGRGPTCTYTPVSGG